MHIVDAGALWPLVRLLRRCHEATSVPGSAAGSVAGKDRRQETDPNDDLGAEAAAICRGHAASCKEAIASLLQNIGHYELHQVSSTAQQQWRVVLMFQHCAALHGTAWCGVVLSD